MKDDELIRQQIDYYRARAPEYNEWFLRQGRYDLGAEHRRQWFREVEELEGVVSSTFRDADVLELACGTGQWTTHLARNNRSVVAIDASPETIALNRQRVASDNVRYVVADIFSWIPAVRFDVVFFSFWLSHVPPARFDEFWQNVRAALKPGGCAFFIDSR